MPIAVAGAAWGALAVAGDRAELDARVDDHLARFARLVGLAVANADAADRAGAPWRAPTG